LYSPVQEEQAGKMTLNVAGIIMKEAELTMALKNGAYTGQRSDIFGGCL